MKEFSTLYRIRECSCYVTSLAMLSYEYILKKKTKNAVSLFLVIDYSKALRVFPSDQMYTAEMRVTTKYEVV